jgi:hypothetical protein
MKQILYIMAILLAIIIAMIVLFFRHDEINEFQIAIRLLPAFFLLVFGIYGLYAELLFKKLRMSGKTNNLCVEASYLIQKRGILSKALLFPFLKIKSSNSLIISFFGALAWVVIALIIFHRFFKS